MWSLLWKTEYLWSLKRDNTTAKDRLFAGLDFDIWQVTREIIEENKRKTKFL